MAVVRFIWFLISPFLASLLLIPLLLGWAILSLAYYLLNTWYRATGDSRYNEYWSPCD